MKRVIPLRAMIVFAPLLAAPVVSSLTGCGSSTPTPTGPVGNVVLTDAHNYASISKLTIPAVQTAPGVDLDVCWDGISKDILCHDVVATTDIDNVSFLQIPNMSKVQVQDKLAVGKLDENLVKIYRDFHVDHAVSPPITCTKLSTFALGSMLDPAVDYVEGATKTYMLLFAHGTTPGIGARTMMFLEPTSASTVTSVSAPDGCSSNILDFTATLGQPLAIPATGDWVLDWSQIGHDSMGAPVLFTKLDNVLVGFYAGKTAADLQSQFLDIELIATSLYEVKVPAGAKHVDLADAKLRGGTEAFPGFGRTDGVWLTAVMCSKCQVPAPVALAILQPQ